MAQKSIQVRIDEKLKRRAEQIFNAVGIDTPTAIRIFFTKVVDRGGIPFELVSYGENYSREQLAYLDKLAEEARQGENLVGPFTSSDELIKELRS